MHDARELTRHLADLLSRERAALGDFLVALADFDREHRWRELGYTNLFDFLHRELGASRGSAYYRKTAAELIQRYPELVEPLRDGRLCITSVVELAKVITPENRSEVVPRFFHASKAEAKAVAAELRPVAAPPRREVVTLIAPARWSARAGYSRDVADGPGHAAASVEAPQTMAPMPVQPVELDATPPNPPPSQAAVTGTAPVDDIEPLTADLRRLHVTVSRRFLAKLEAARDALAHAHRPGDTEAVLEAALDLLLEEQARRRGLVKHPRSTPPRPSGRPRHVPAAVKRAVWTRDGGRCQTGSRRARSAARRGGSSWTTSSRSRTAGRRRSRTSASPAPPTTSSRPGRRSGTRGWSGSARPRTGSAPGPRCTPSPVPGTTPPRGRR